MRKASRQRAVMNLLKRLSPDLVMVANRRHEDRPRLRHELLGAQRKRNFCELWLCYFD